MFCLCQGNMIKMLGLSLAVGGLPVSWRNHHWESVVLSRQLSSGSSVLGTSKGKWARQPNADSPGSGKLEPGRVYPWTAQALLASGCLVACDQDLGDGVRRALKVFSLSLHLWAGCEGQEEPKFAQQIRNIAGPSPSPGFSLNLLGMYQVKPSALTYT